jgi:ferredoxin
LISETYCDGLGDCLPECPTGAISLEEREAPAFDEEAVKKNMESRKKN